MEWDPVCGMKFNNIQDAPRSIYKGSMVYFCCPKCKEMFDKDPETFISGIHFDLNSSAPKPEKCDCEDTILIIHGYRI